MNRTTKTLLAGLSLSGLLGGCAAIAPAQLVQARASYATSSTGQTAKLAPTDLYDAKKSLDRANAEFDANGDSLAVRDYAYIAVRKVDRANATARTEIDRATIAEATKQGIVVRDYQVRTGQIALADSRAQLKNERAANDVATADLQATNVAQGNELEKTAGQLEKTSGQLAKTTGQLEKTTGQLEKTSGQLEKTAGQLETEKAARKTAEAKLAGAMKDLATIAAVKEEARGVVITLNGSVLFASGKYALLETAKTRLNQVAEALKAQDDDRKMIVEGHTDSQGSNATNEPLSFNRATAVRDYLVGRGVDGKKIIAVGMGARRPLLDNANAENRANNRRVEIVIQPTQLTAR